MEEIERQLALANEKTIASQGSTSKQVQYRNHMIREALKAGISWNRVIEITGLSRGMIAIIAKEGK